MSADVTIEAAANEEKTTRALRVSKITREAQDIASFELVDPLGLELPRFTAGAHLDVRINDDIRRQYSLCNDPQERDRYVIAVLNEPAGRGGSRAMHEQIAIGSVLLVWRRATASRWPGVRRASTCCWRAASASRRCWR